MAAMKSAVASNAKISPAKMCAIINLNENLFIAIYIDLYDYLLECFSLY